MGRGGLGGGAAALRLCLRKVSVLTLFRCSCFYLQVEPRRRQFLIFVRLKRGFLPLRVAQLSRGGFDFGSEPSLSHSRAPN